MSTYVQLVNKVLIRLNDVTVDPAGDGFDTLRNVQQLAKNSVNDSIRTILQVGQEWPFLKTTYTQTLTPDVREYDFPADYSSSDYDSFYLKKLSSENNSPAYLPVITYEDYTKNFRAIDDEGDSSVPEYVYQTYGEAFGVTPAPNAAYEIEYTYWKFPADLSLYNDECVIPTRFDNVIVDGAMMYMMRFRSNDQSAAMHQQTYGEGINRMKRVLIDEPIRVRSTVIEGSTNAG